MKNSGITTSYFLEYNNNLKKTQWNDITFFPIESYALSSEYLLDSDTKPGTSEILEFRDNLIQVFSMQVKQKIERLFLITPKEISGEYYGFLFLENKQILPIKVIGSPLFYKWMEIVLRDNYEDRDMQSLLQFASNEYSVVSIGGPIKINNPQTPMDYFGNALRFWIMGFNLASAQAFEQAGDMGWETVYCYKRAFWRSCRSEGHEEYTLELYDKIMTYDPTQREWLIDYRYAYILYTLKKYEQAIKAYKMLMEYYPDTAFEEEKDYNHNVAVLLDCERNLGNIEAATRYTSMRMSWQTPQKSDCKRLQVMADEHYTEELFLRYNLLRLSEEIETGLSQNEKESLKDIKRKLKSEYFS